MESVWTRGFSLKTDVAFRNQLTLVDVGRVGLLAGLAALLLLASGSGGSLLASLLLLGRSLSSRGLPSASGSLTTDLSRSHF